MIGETLGGKYKLISLLGEGGMGAVYEAENTATLERVAVKLIKTQRLSRGSEVTKRFRREAKAASSIDCPHVVRILDSGADETTGNLYMVMEYLAGEDLQRLIARVGPLPPDVALRVVSQALLGLQKAHEAGVVHRDIKPANIFLAQQADGDVTVKIVDFGIAKIRADPLNASPTTGLTDTGGFLGSPLYMSPEQVHNSKRVDHRTDLWSIGSALYCALAGRAPHQHIESAGTLVIAICSEPAPLLKRRAPWVPKEIADVVHRALAIKAEHRYPTAAAMLEALRPFISDGFALRQEMLVGVGAEERAVVSTDVTLSLEEVPLRVERDSASRMAEHMTTASIDVPPGQEILEPLVSVWPEEGEGTAPAESERHVIGVGSSRPVLGHESTAPIDTTTSGQEKAPPKGARLAPGRGRWAVIVVLALGGAGAAAFKLMQPAAPAPAVSAPAAMNSPTPVADLPAPPSAPAPAAKPERIQRSRLIVSPADASVMVDDTRAEVRDGAVEISGRLGSKHQVRVSKGERERRQDVVLSEDGVIPPKVELALSKPLVVAPKPSIPPVVTASASPSPPPPRKPEDVLMPAEPR